MKEKIVTVCPGCGKETEDSADQCRYCGVRKPRGSEKRREQADLLMKIGAMIFIFGLFQPLLFVSGGIVFGAGAVIWVMYRK